MAPWLLLDLSSHNAFKPHYTPLNFGVCARRKVPEKCFKICHISYTQSCRHRPGHSLGKNVKLHKMKNEKNYMGFLIH